jgi:hypothetical protein
MMVILAQVWMVEDPQVFLLEAQDHRLMFHHVHFQLLEQVDVMVTIEK